MTNRISRNPSARLQDIASSKYRVKKIKSPLRYPGGKSRAVKHISQYIPTITSMVSPFFGGGSIEIAQATKGVEVKGYDIFDPLVCFWKYQLGDRQGLYDAIQKLHPMSKEQFSHYQTVNPTLPDGVEKAAMFYALNRASFSGSTMSGGMSIGHDRFNASNMETVLNFTVPSLSVEHGDFAYSITKNPDAFLYLDPPYLLQGAANSLYGNKGSTHRGFNHGDLFDLVKDRPNWIMSYNGGDGIKQRYADFHMTTPQWSYGMTKDRQATASNEVLIFSRDYDPPSHKFTG